MKQITIFLLLILSTALATPETLIQTSDLIKLKSGHSYEIILDDESSSTQSFKAYLQETPSTVTFSVDCTEEAPTNIFFDSSLEENYSKYPSPSNGYKLSTYPQLKETNSAQLATVIDEQCSIYFTLYYENSDARCTITYKQSLNSDNDDDHVTTITAVIVISASIGVLLIVIIILNCKGILRKIKNTTNRLRRMLSPRSSRKQATSASQPSSQTNLVEPNQQGATTEQRAITNDEEEASPNPGIENPDGVIINIEDIVEGRETRVPPNDEGRDSSMSVSVPEERTVDIPEDLQCIICLYSKKSIAFLPCKHICACQPCSLKVLELQSKCPLCRSEIETIEPGNPEKDDVYK